jgi:uncharacterized protein YraI
MNKLFAAALIATAALTSTAAMATQAWVGQNQLNARSGPGTNYSVLGSFDPCTPVDVVENQYGWSKVYYNNTYYWVSSQYLQNYACTYTPPVQTYTPPTYTPPAYTPPTYTPPAYTPPKKAYNNGYGGTNNY